MSTLRIPTYVSGASIRKSALNFGASIAGMATVLQLLAILPGISAIPTVFAAPYIPITVIGIAYWFASGRYRDSIAVWLIIAVLVVSLLWSSHIALGGFLLLTVAMMIALGALIVDETDWLRAARLFSVGHIVSVLVLLSVSYFPHLYGVVTYERVGWVRDKNGAVILDPNQVGFQAGFSILIALSLLQATRGQVCEKRDRIILVLGTSLALGMIVLTQSRGALAATVGAVGVAIFLGSVGRRVSTWLLSVIVAALGALVIGLLGSGIVERLVSDDVQTANGRTIIWSEAIELATKDIGTLLFGAGTSSGPYALGRHDPTLVSLLSWGAPPRVESAQSGLAVGIHSGYFSWLLDFGLAGVFIAAMAVFLALVRARTVDENHPFAVGQAIVVFVLLVSVSLSAYHMSGISIACGAMSLAYLYHYRTSQSGTLRCGESSAVKGGAAP